MYDSHLSCFWISSILNVLFGDQEPKKWHQLSEQVFDFQNGYYCAVPQVNY